jgi:hypothetical protein
MYYLASNDSKIYHLMGLHGRTGRTYTIEFIREYFQKLKFFFHKLGMKSAMQALTMHKLLSTILLDCKDKFGNNYEFITALPEGSKKELYNTYCDGYYKGIECYENNIQFRF